MKEPPGITFASGNPFSVVKTDSDSFIAPVNFPAPFLFSILPVEGLY